MASPSPQRRAHVRARVFVCMLGIFAAAIGTCRADGVCGSTLLQNTTFNGHDLKPVTKRHTSTPAECCKLCASFPGCKVWSWVGDKNAGAYYTVCWLKSSAAGKEADAIAPYLNIDEVSLQSKLSQTLTLTLTLTLARNPFSVG